MSNKIEPSILKGTRDFLPEDMAKRNQVLDKIRETFQQFGYEQIETPILSKAEAILGEKSETGQKMAYSFKDYGQRDVALPFDLTMPFARFVAANYQDLPMPFKRFQIQRVWRAENPQRGRLREFYQCDVDVIGSDDLTCEAEMTKLVIEVFDRLKISNITIRVNSRRLLNEVLKTSGVSADKLVSAIRAIDKLDKIGEQGVISELKKNEIGNGKEIIDLLKPAETNKTTLSKLEAYDTTDLQEFMNLCEQFSIPEGKILIDPSLARGLDYYTGITFEVVSEDSSLGTICAGGRYDDLAGMFSKQSFSGIGVSFGFERIMLLMEELNLLSGWRAASQVLITVFNKDFLPGSIKIYDELLNAGVAAEIYLSEAKLSKQFKFADKKGIPFVVVQGPDEVQNNEVVVRRMASGKQKNIPSNQLASYVTGYYDAG